jgi:transposase
VRELAAVAALRQIWAQQYAVPDDDGSVHWRDEQDLPPGAELIISPYDLEARLSAKRSITWIGYKVHVSETYPDDGPHLITHIETTEATLPDAQALGPIHSALQERDLLPEEHLLDAGYVDSERLVESQREYQVNLVGPAPADSGWQARTGQGYDVSCFTVNWDSQTVTCPAGAQSTEWKATFDRHDKEVIHVEFRRQTCAACAVREQCTRSKTTGREITLRPRESARPRPHLNWPTQHVRVLKERCPKASAYATCARRAIGAWRKPACKKPLLRPQSTCCE